MRNQPHLHNKSIVSQGLPALRSALWKDAGIGSFANQFEWFGPMGPFVRCDDGVPSLVLGKSSDETASGQSISLKASSLRSLLQ